MFIRAHSFTVLLSFNIIYIYCFYLYLKNCFQSLLIQIEDWWQEESALNYSPELWDRQQKCTWYVTPLPWNYEIIHHITSPTAKGCLLRWLGLRGKGYTNDGQCMQSLGLQRMLRAVYPRLPAIGWLIHHRMALQKVNLLTPQLLLWQRNK